MSGHFHQKRQCQLWCSLWCSPSLTSLLRYCKDIAEVPLWVFWECLIIPINNDSITLWKTFEINLQETLVFICMQKTQLHLYRFFWNIVKTLQTSNFGNFGNAWPSHQKSLHRQFHAYLLAKKRLHHSLTHFLKILERNSKLVILGHLCKTGHTHLKW